MRGPGVAVAVAASAVLHVAGLGVLDAIDDDPLVAPALPRPRLTLEPRPTAADDDAPIEVVLLPGPVVPAAPTAPADAAAPTAPGAPSPRPAAPPLARADGPVPPAAAAPGDDDRLALATSIDPRSHATEPGTGEPGPAVPGALSMRNPRALGAGVDLWHPSLTIAPPDPSKPAYVPPEPSGQLHPDGGGTFRTVQPGFTGHVDRDGRVSFTDTPSFSIHVNVPRPTKIARAAARGLERWYADPGAALRAGEADPDELPGVRALETKIPAREDPEPVILPIITGGFDPTDAVMRAAGQDPYAAAKLKWMDETRAERLAMATAHKKEQLAHATQSMRRHLARLWRTPGLDDAARRALLFELWDDCDDGAGADADVAAACERTRAAVIASIRSHLPAGSPGAFTADELRAFNGRRKAPTPFAPY